MALAGVCTEIIIVAAADQQQTAQAAIHSCGNLPVPAQVVPGGDTRQESVAQGLCNTSPTTTHVLIHDAARSFTPSEVFIRVRDALRDGAEAVVPVTAVTDSLREHNGCAVDRSLYRAVQTPQGFCKATLVAAHEVARHTAAQATDDASLVESNGSGVTQVEGHPHSIKITHPLDLIIAEHLAARQPQGSR